MDAAMVQQTCTTEPSRDTVRDVVTSFASNGALSTAELLKELRRAFPEMPLAERIAVLSELAKL